MDKSRDLGPALSSFRFRTFKTAKNLKLVLELNIILLTYVTLWPATASENLGSCDLLLGSLAEEMYLQYEFAFARS